PCSTSASAGCGSSTSRSPRPPSATRRSWSSSCSWRGGSRRFRSPATTSPPPRPLCSRASRPWTPAEATAVPCAGRSGVPDLAEQAGEVAADDLLHARGRPAAPGEVLAQGEQLPRPVVFGQVVVDVGPVAGAGDAFANALLVVRLLPRAGLVVQHEGVDAAVGADAHVVLAADLHRVLQVGDQVLAAGVAGRVADARAQVGHEV